MIRENTVGEKGCGPVTLLRSRVSFQNKVMFVLTIMLIYEEPLLSGQPSIKQPLAGTPRVAAYWGFTCTSLPSETQV